jgi:hypothetical protein
MDVINRKVGPALKTPCNNNPACLQPIDAAIAAAVVSYNVANPPLAVPAGVVVVTMPAPVTGPTANPPTEFI